MDEHSYISIYWLVLFVGGIAVFYRFSEKTTRDRLQGTKGEIKIRKKIFADKGIDLISQIDTTLRQILEPVEKGVIRCGLIALLILIVQVGLIFFDSETSSKTILVIFSLLLIFLFIDSMCVFTSLNREAERLHGIYMKERVYMEAKAQLKAKAQHALFN